MSTGPSLSYKAWASGAGPRRVPAAIIRIESNSAPRIKVTPSPGRINVCGLRVRSVCPFRVSRTLPDAISRAAPVRVFKRRVR
jgi:hypothetical protein